MGVKKDDKPKGVYPNCRCVYLELDLCFFCEDTVTEEIGGGDKDVKKETPKPAEPRGETGDM